KRLTSSLLHDVYREMVDLQPLTAAPNFESEKHVREEPATRNPAVGRVLEKRLQIAVERVRGRLCHVRHHRGAAVCFQVCSLRTRSLTTRAYPNVPLLAVDRHVVDVASDRLSLRRIEQPQLDEAIEAVVVALECV